MTTARKRKTQALSTRQQQMLAYIRDHIRTQGYPPTLREIGDVLAISSTSVVSYHFERLERAGYLERRPGVARGIRLLERA